MIKNLIDENRINIHFQPIVSIKDKKIFAYEALTRAKDSEGTPISPLTVFEEARKENLTITLDNYVRELSFRKFKTIYDQNNDVLLFLNLESYFVDEELKDNFVELTKKYDIPAQNIVIEIKEDAIRDNSHLEVFVEHYRRLGFILAIDDFGTGYSSFDRLSIIKPDIVKIDRSLIYNIQNNYVNKQILSAISTMCNNIGALVLAEGVEEKDEILTCMRKDIDIFQGFWFSKPKDMLIKEQYEEILSKIDNVGKEYSIKVKDTLNKRKELLKNIKSLIKDKLLKASLDNTQFFNELKSLVSYYDTIEAVYVLNYDNGVQVGDTFIDTPKKTFYTPTKDGHDHSLKYYYYVTKDSSKGDYLGARYVSKASGNSCRTYSINVKIGESKYIVCLDLVNKYI